MPPSDPGPAFEPFMATAEAVIVERPHVDPEMIREIFSEAATMLHNGLALDGLDEHDADAVVAGLCVALVDADPGAAVRAQAQSARDERGDLHDPEEAAAAYLTAAAILQI